MQFYTIFLIGTSHLHSFFFYHTHKSRSFSFFPSLYKSRAITITKFFSHNLCQVYILFRSFMPSRPLYRHVPLRTQRSTFYSVGLYRSIQCPLQVHCIVYLISLPIPHSQSQISSNRPFHFCSIHPTISYICKLQLMYFYLNLYWHGDNQATNFLTTLGYFYTSYYYVYFQQILNENK
jgi:hypothetical protein